MEETKQVENFKKYPSEVKFYKRKGNKVLFQGNPEAFELIVLSDDVFRLRFAPDSCFDRDFSYAIKPDFAPEEVEFGVKETENQIVVSTVKVLCVVQKVGLKVNFYTADKKPILEDEIGFHWEQHQLLNGNFVYCSKKIQEEERFFGLGDKPAYLNLREKRVQNWNSDKYGFEKDTDPMYKDVSFYYGLHHNLAYGLFFDNSFRKSFDFGFEDAKVASFWADGGEMNYYFIFGPELIKVAERYAWLTGTCELPSLWSLGYHQSKWSYFPEQKVMEIAHEFRVRKIPCDAIHLDIDYMDGFRCFTWDKTRFPDPAELFENLNELGFTLIPIIDPGIKVDPEYPVFLQGLEKNFFCKKSEGELMKGDVWPGLCCFPDFTNPDVRNWWGTLFKDLVKLGVMGIWNDMNEPTVFGQVTFPDDVRHNYDGDNSSHRKAHNVYGMQMARATFEGLKKLLHEKRPFTLTRAGYAGVQRYSAVWTGDNLANWEHVWLANVQCQRLSISGISFTGSDVGGFIGEPDPQLFARWIQLGTFHPFLRSHSSGDKGDKEPWIYGEKVEKIARKYIELRYKLLPYIYTTFWQHVTNGTPVLRPLTFLDQEDPETHHRMDEFGFGPHLLVCPVAHPDIKGRWLYVPKGGWYNFWDDTFYDGGLEVWINTPLDIIPLFVKAGTVLPLYPVQQYVGEKTIKSISLHIYYIDGSLESSLFEDEGEGYGYLRKEYNLVRFEVTGGVKYLKVSRKMDHLGYKTSYTSYDITLHGLAFTPKNAVVDSTAIELKYTKKGNLYTFNCPAGFEVMEIM